jgi:hypothetical protein
MVEKAQQKIVMHLHQLLTTDTFSGNLDSFSRTPRPAGCARKAPDGSDVRNCNGELTALTP